MQFSVYRLVVMTSFVVARMASLPQQLWSSVLALAPNLQTSVGRNLSKTNARRWVDRTLIQHRIHSSRKKPVFSVHSDMEFDSSTICHDASVLQVLDPDTVQEIETLVQERSKARWTGNYAAADELKAQITNLALPSGYELALKDLPRNEGGASRWNVIPTKDIIQQGPTILQLAHAAMGLAVEHNQQPKTLARQQYKQESLLQLVETAKARLAILLEETAKMDAINAVFEVSTKNTMVQTELGGRTAADAALWFAFAGSQDSDLFAALADIASWELERFGKRPSFRSKYTLQILERFAAAGLRQHDKLERVASSCLQDENTETTPNFVLENGLNLHSDRSLLLIWKTSSKQKKQRAFLRSVTKHWGQFQQVPTGENSENNPTANTKDALEQETNTIPKPLYDWNELFQDPSRPLVVDVGCGMGVSLLGLASTEGSQESSLLLLDDQLQWSDCNFVGVDLGALGIDYARGVATRWNRQEHLHFCVDAAEDFCQQLESYPGEVRCCMIQFPTPFRLQHKDTGNSQLPASQVEGFMVTENLLEIIHSSLHPTKGRLLLQSNCEDVAVWMRHLASNVGFAIVEDDEDAPAVSSNQRLTQRTADYIDMGGERAQGKGWFRREILHRKGATETEVSCAINGTPVHRCILKVDESESI